MAHFFVISTALSNKLVAASNALHVYTPLLTADGRLVCTRATLQDFPPELFNGHSLRAVELMAADFPPPAANPFLPN